MELLLKETSFTIETLRAVGFALDNGPDIFTLQNLCQGFEVEEIVPWEHMKGNT